MTYYMYFIQTFIIRCTVSEILAKIDHKSGKIRFNVKRPKAYQRLMWQYQLADFDRYRTKLSEVDWDACYISEDIDDVTQCWTDTLISVANDCIPNKMVTVRPPQRSPCTPPPPHDPP